MKKEVWTTVSYSAKLPSIKGINCHHHARVWRTPIPWDEASLGIYWKMSLGQLGQWWGNQHKDGRKISVNWAPTCGNETGRTARGRCNVCGLDGRSVLAQHAWETGKKEANSIKYVEVVSVLSHRILVLLFLFWNDCDKQGMVQFHVFFFLDIKLVEWKL